MKSVTILAQIHAAKNNPVAALFGGIIGAVVPLAGFELSHKQVQGNSALWLIVAPALLFSALTVFAWGMRLFLNESETNRGFARAKSFGLVALLEASMTFAHGWLPYAMLGILILINAIELAYAMVEKQEASRLATETAERLKAERKAHVIARKTAQAIKPKRNRKPVSEAVRAIQDTAPLTVPEAARGLIEAIA